MAEIYLGNIKGPQGLIGPQGKTGNGIKNITKTSSEGLIDTYTIEYTDGSKTTFDVKNGEVSQEQLNVVDNKVIDTRNELERVKNEVLETGTDTDTYIHLEDSAMSEYQELEVDGVCKQTLTSVENGDEYDSPSPNYPQPIEVIENSLRLTSCNKNLFDTTKIASGTSQDISYSVDNNGVIILNGTTNGNSIEIPLNTNISLNGTYTYIPKISDITKINNLALKDASFNNVFLSQLPITRNVNGIVTKIVIYVSSGMVFNNDTLSIQILKGTQSTETDFIKHLESQIIANIPEGEFVGKISETAKDTLEVRYNEEDGNYHLVLNKKIGKVVLDGTQEISQLTTSTSGKYRYAIRNIGAISTTGVENKKIICNLLKEIARDYTYTSQMGIAYGGANDNGLIFYFEEISQLTLNEVKQYFIDNNLIAYYLINTPYEIDLGIVDMPIAYDKITNLFTNSDLLPNINVKYYRNFEKTIQNLQVNEKALKQELIDINSRLSALENSLVNVESEVVE